MRYQVFGGLLLIGCAGTVSRTEMTTLRQKLQESERRSALAEQKLDDLESKVFLLTDQVESQKVASLRRDPPRLPVIRLAPAAEPTAETQIATADNDGEVEFSGDARPRASRGETPRPVLRIEGPGAGASAATTHKKAAPHEAQSRPQLTNDGIANDSNPKAAPVTIDPKSSDNLGVAPAPRVDSTIKNSSPSPKISSKEAIDPLKLYSDAYRNLKAGHHEDAIGEFRQFVKLFPAHDYADNAQYWLGESFYDQKRYPEAAIEFRVVVDRYPSGNKAPDALLKLSYCLLQTGDRSHGVSLLKQVSSSYPLTDAARLAQERLGTMSKEGAK